MVRVGPRRPRDGPRGRGPWRPAAPPRRTDRSARRRAGKKVGS